MLGISPFGMVHTVISLVAVAAGVVAFVRFKEISPRTAVGKTYVWMTILTCLTGFFIFHHGGFGPAHALGIITLVVLGVAWAAGKGKFGGASRYVETICYTMTFFFHMIPTIMEGLTRLPAGHPVAATQQDPLITKLIGVAFVLFLAGAALQLVRLRRK